MSAICIVNLKESNLTNEFNNYKKLTREVVQSALDNNIAVFFNSYDYGPELVYDAKMKNFFLISDSFFYKHSDELLRNFELGYDWGSKDFQEKFNKKYFFFEEILRIVFKYNVQFVEIYISEEEPADCVSEFETVKSSVDTVITDLYNCVIDHSEEYAYDFPPIKLEIKNPNL